MRGIHWSLMGSPHKVLVGQEFEICFVINVNKPLYKSQFVSYLRGHGVTVMQATDPISFLFNIILVLTSDIRYT